MDQVLVTGYTGKIAPTIVSELEEEFGITLFCRKYFKSKHSIVLGDITSKQNCLDAINGVDLVVHLAACSEPNPAAFEVNVIGTYNMLEAARIGGVKRFVFASTNCVYGHCFPISGRQYRLEYLPIDENHPLRPEDNYGITKLLAEELLKTYSLTWGMYTAALRLSWVWGEDETNWRINLDNFETGKYAPYFWSYVDVLDVARAFHLALTEANLPQYGVYNITAADTMADKDTADLIAHYYPGVEIKANFSGRKSLFNCSRAKDGFNYEAQYSWRRKK